MRRSLITLCLFALLAGAFASAQEKPEFTVKSSLKGSDVPEYYLYESFFKIAFEALRQEGDIREEFLKTRIGVPSGSAIEGLVEAAIVEGYELLTAESSPAVQIGHPAPGVTVTNTTGTRGALDPKDFESDGAYMAALKERERQQARELGRILGKLEASLEAEGFSTLRLERYVRERLGASTSMISDEDLTVDQHIWQVEQSFESGRQAGRKAGGR